MMWRSTKTLKTGEGCAGYVTAPIAAFLLVLASCTTTASQADEEDLCISKEGPAKVKFINMGIKPRNDRHLNQVREVYIDRIESMFDRYTCIAEAENTRDATVTIKPTLSAPSSTRHLIKIVHKYRHSSSSQLTPRRKSYRVAAHKQAAKEADSVLKEILNDTILSEEEHGSFGSLTIDQANTNSSAKEQLTIRGTPSALGPEQYFVYQLYLKLNNDDERALQHYFIVQTIKHSPDGEEEVVLALLNTPKDLSK